MRSWVARQGNIPRGRTIPMGAVPVLARGLGHMVPTYLRRRPGSPSNGFLGSALALRRFGDPSCMTRLPMKIEALDETKAELRRSALARRRAIPASVRESFSE